MIHRHLVSALCLLAALTTACAGREIASSPIPQPPAAPGPAALVTPQPPPGPPVSPEEALRASVTRFWDARLKGDLVKQYDVLEPEVREWVTLTAFIRSRGTVDYKSYEIQSVNVVGDRGWAKVKYTFAVRMSQLSGRGPWSGEHMEVWVLRDGLWYRPYGQKEAANPPASVR